ncbi:T9SS type A sorting domain-containing protein [Flavobacterium sp. H122]|uniref:T9SS type A sorting domain-containing protein n=1 Tax=Flavobacterium sp. H122 TaxID=2529860 RepID=UPI0010AA8233|nr:T9SS type A sorting domain-containing protein [Flavobacterium sp. H122]
MKTILIFGLLVCNFSFAQHSVNSSGGETAGVGGSAGFSIGEVIYSNYSNASGSVLEGIQLPFEIVTLNNSVFAKDVQLLVFPNPTTSVLILRISQEVNSGLKYQLFDSHGKLIETQNNLKVENEIDVSGLSAAIYFLKIFNGSDEVNTFKIIKN